MIMTDEKSGRKNMNDDIFTSLLSNELQDEYLNFVKNRFGIIIKREHKELAKAVKHDCDKYNISPVELLAILKSSDDESESLNRIVSAITIGETYFFRDKHQMKVLSEMVLPAIIKRKLKNNERSLRVWSAGCSSGEEIYTIIMLIKDIVNNLDDWQYFFLATDINLDVLKKGISGRYGEWSMRSIPQEYLKRYFIKDKNQYQLCDEIKNLVTFDYLNLNGDSYPSLMSGTMMHDLIICRNVLIYFDTDHTMKIINRLARSLSDSGYIMLGASDPVAMLQTGLSASDECASLFTVKPVSSHQAARVLIKSDVVHDIHRIPLNPKKSVQIAKSSSVSVDQIIGLASESKWDEVLVLIANAELSGELSTSIMNVKAMALANTGKLNDALKVCEECIDKNKMNKDAYFLYALIMSESRKWKESESAFRKALYIDPEFLLCRYQFGLFLIRHGKIDEGMRALNNVVKSASKFDENELLPDSNNMRYKDLISAVTNVLELHQ